MLEKKLKFVNYIFELSLELCDILARRVSFFHKILYKIIYEILLKIYDF